MQGMERFAAAAIAVAATMVFVPAASGLLYTVNDTNDFNYDGNCGNAFDADPDNDCTIRDAVQVSGGTPAADEIYVPDQPAGTTYKLVNPLAPNFNNTGTITIRGGAPYPMASGVPPQEFSVIEAANGQRAMDLGGSVVLEDIFIQGADDNGFPNPPNPTPGSGGLINAGNHSLTIRGSGIGFGNAQVNGGAIEAGGQLTVTDSALISNRTSGFGGGVHLGGSSTATFERSIFPLNQAGLGGGGIMNEGALTVENSIFLVNSAADFGGGIDNFDGAGPASATVRSSTFVSNVADANNNGTGGGAGTQQSDPDGSFTVTNSAYVENHLVDPAGALNQCGVANGASFASGGFNIRQSADGGCSGFGAAGDATAKVNYGGNGLVPTLLAGPGVNHGGPCPATDLFGTSRGAFAPCDVGAVESSILPPAAPSGGAPAPTPAVKCPKGKKLKKGKCVKKKKKKRKK